MTEELNLDQDGQDIQVDPMLQEAQSMGWTEKDEWKGDESRWVEAGEFVRRKELANTLSSNKRDLSAATAKIGELEVALKGLGEHNKQIAKQEYEKARVSLKSQKAEAMEENDYERVVDLDEKLGELKESKRSLDQQPPAPAKAQQKMHPDVEHWMGANKWYHEDAIMRGAADALAQEFLSKNPQSANNPAVVLDHVNAKISETFTDRMQPRRRPGATFDTDTNRGRQTSSKPSKRDLNEDQLRVAKTLVNAGAFETVQEYVDQLAAIGELG